MNGSATTRDAAPDGAARTGTGTRASSGSARVAGERVGRRIEIEGVVQGVGFRPWIYRLAREHGLSGTVRNDDAGVTIEVWGSAGALDRFVERLGDRRGRDAPATAAIESVRSSRLPPGDGDPSRDDPSPLRTARAGEPTETFVIVESVGNGHPRLSIPADVATCERCLAEVHDPADRRFGYPFTNCTDCGPRYTIATGLPYDRPATTMAGFELCPCCRAEYEDPLDRRFHAQPNACPVCGPRLVLLDAAGQASEVASPLATAIATLRNGEIVAIEGLGGFHLACCASSAAAVRRLRERKRRSAKPFAVMVRDLETARRIAVLGAQDELWLARPERPIVLVERRLVGPRVGAAIADEIAPDNRLIGLFLPYTALHHLLLEGTNGSLVMTSGNRADEPIVIDPEEAVRRLAGVADAFLVHDRPIAARCDDSVLRLHADGPVLLRRSRGFVPRALRLRGGLRFARPTLGCGAQLKTAVCLGVDDAAYFGAHVGDLECLDALEAYEESIDHLERLLGVRAEVLAHDLHPDFLSTRWAHARASAASTGDDSLARIERIAVQHHHAHFAAVLAEHPEVERALAVTWDGFGLGSDGAAWGGEILLGDAASSRRVATLRPIGLAGGDVAVREVWRLALALLEDAYDGTLDGAAPLDALALFSTVDRRRLGQVRQMLSSGIATTPSHAAGRLFDAIGSLLLAAPVARYEAEIAMRLEQAAKPAAKRAASAAPYPFELDAPKQENGPGSWPEPAWQIDHRPMTRAIVADLLSGVPTARIAARFHDTLVAALAETLARAATIEPVRVVALTGGCLVNRRLADPLRAALEPSFEVIRPRHAPPGDGGISLGQAIAVAAASARGMGEPTCV